MKRALLAGLMILAPLGTEVTVIQNATIMSEGPKGTFKGSIVVTNGKITEVGDKVMVPPGATVIDAQGFQTVVSLFNVDLTSKPDPDLFHIQQAMPGGPNSRH